MRPEISLSLLSWLLTSSMADSSGSIAGGFYRKRVSGVCAAGIHGCKSAIAARAGPSNMRFRSPRSREIRNSR